jgi:hypothetical protein
MPITAVILAVSKMIADLVLMIELVITADHSATIVRSTRISRHTFMVRLIRQFPKLLVASRLREVLVLAASLSAAAGAQEATWLADSDAASLDAAYFGEQPVRLASSLVEPAAYDHQGVPCNRCNPGGTLVGGCPGDGCVVPGTNLFWCSPYPERVEDPCGTDPCLNCNFNPVPLWYASVEIVPLFRDQKDDQIFQTLGPGGPAVLESGDFETEFDAGMRLLLGATLTERYRLEGAYLGSYEWSDHIAVRNFNANTLGGTGNLFSPFSNFGRPTGISGVDFNRFASIEMTSSFNSVELNLRRRCCNRPKMWPYRDHHCIANSFLLGLRYLDVDERFRYVTQSAIPVGVGSVNRALIDTTNELFGVQVGMLSQFTTYWDSGWIDFEIKGGIYHNEASLRSAYDAADGGNAPISSFVGADERDRTSFLGEISLSYTHQFTSNMSARLGYNAFWLTGVAVASENMSTNINILSLGPAQVDHGGDLVYHGPTLGFIFAY